MRDPARSRHPLMACTLAFALGASASTAGAVPVVIDSFNSGQQGISNNSAGQTVGSGVAASNALGGTRVLSITNGPFVFNSVFQVSPSLGRLDFASQTAPPSNNTIFVVKYDGTTSSTLSPTGLGGLDLLASGNAGISVTGNNTSSGTERVTFRAYSSAVNFSDASVDYVSGAFKEQRFVPFSSFTATGGTGASFANLGALTVTIRYAPPGLQGGSGSLTALSFTPDPLAAVPEPSSLALFAFGGAALALRLRRRRR